MIQKYIALADPTIANSGDFDGLTAVNSKIVDFICVSAPRKRKYIFSSLGLRNFRIFAS